MMRYIVITMAIFISGCANNLIGEKVPPYPENMYSKSGACITAHLGYERMCEYSVGILQNIEHENIAVLAKRSLKKHPNDANNWLVTDQIPYPKIIDGFWLAFGTCRINKKLDQTVVAVVKDTTTEFQQAYNWAWQVNLENGKFQKIEAVTVTCYNEGWGI